MIVTKSPCLNIWPETHQKTLTVPQSGPRFGVLFGGSRLTGINGQIGQQEGAQRCHHRAQMALKVQVRRCLSPAVSAAVYISGASSGGRTEEGGKVHEGPFAVKVLCSRSFSITLYKWCLTR